MSNDDRSAALKRRSTETDWDARYKQGKDSLPWDTGEPAPELVKFIESLEATPESVLEIGCGTGTNAIWLAKHGAKVVATDLSQTAIDMAKRKVDKSTSVEFKVSNIMEKCPVAPASVDLVFDRGVYHVMQPEQRQTFINRVAEALNDGGYWLCLAGSADEIREDPEDGPPQLMASELVDIAEQKFEIHSLQRGAFVMPSGAPRLMWQVVYRKRRAR